MSLHSDKHLHPHRTAATAPLTCTGAHIQPRSPRCTATPDVSIDRLCIHSWVARTPRGVGCDVGEQNSRPQPRAPHLRPLQRPRRRLRLQCMGHRGSEPQGGHTPQHHPRLQFLALHPHIPTLERFSAAPWPQAALHGRTNTRSQAWCCTWLEIHRRRRAPCVGGSTMLYRLALTAKLLT